MTARKTHFDFHGEDLAFCGAVPRKGAMDLEVSTRRKDVDCAKCLKHLAEYDAEVASSEDAYPEDALTVADGPTNLAGPTNDLQRSIADRHGLDVDVVRDAFANGILKR